MKWIVFIAIASWLVISGSISASDKNSLKEVRVALFSDIHIMRGTNEATKALHRKHFDRVIAEVNAARVDVVVIAGDMTENGTPDEIGDFRAQKAGLKAPVYYVPGNHDVGNKRLPGKEPKPKDNVINNWRLARFEMRWGPSFFTHDCAGVRVIGLNASLVGSDLRREPKMWRMLEKELARTNGRPVIAFLHFPPFEKKADEPGGVYWNLEPPQRTRLLRLFKQGGVKVVLSGHTHREIINRDDGILYVTSPAVSYGLPKGKQLPGWTLVTVPMEGEVKTEFHYLRD